MKSKAPTITSTKNVTFGTKTFTIKSLTIKASKEWRKKFVEKTTEILGPLAGSLDFDVQNMQDISQMGGLLDTAKRFILDFSDEMLSLLYEYSPVLRQNQEWIEEHGYEDQVMTAFMEVLSLAFPFGSSMGKLMTFGQDVIQQTSKSLPSANGDSNSETS